jgi:hypothetical protein
VHHSSNSWGQQESVPKAVLDDLRGCELQACAHMPPQIGREFCKAEQELKH